jgi:hypothetical protein
MPDTFNLDAVRDSFEIDNLISYIDGTPFYGFDLDRIRIVATRAPQHPLEVFLSWSYLWILGLGFLWSLFNLKKNVVAPFVAASSLLVLLCAIPYTGWLVGYFVSARMLWRVPWMLPTGLIAFILLRELFDGLAYVFSKYHRILLQGEHVLLTSLTLLCLVLTGFYSEFVYQYQGQSTTAQLEGYRDHLSRLAELGYFLESETEEPVRFAAPAELMNYLPGISSKSKAVIFRNKDWTPYPIDEEEINNLFSHDFSISMDQRIQVLEKYQIQYVLVEQPSIGKYYAGYPKYFELQYIDGYWLFKYLAYHGNGNN